MRITPVDVNSRPSSCLTNFLLSGRSVMLEMPRKSGASVKTLSHMLAAHGGEIFLHGLSSNRVLTLEDPPSISEGPGGRVTDYRITDLAEVMKANRVAPYFKDGSLEAKSRSRLNRFTSIFPLTGSTTVIFNMASLERLQRLMVNGDPLSENELTECRKAIFNLISMENKGEILPVPIGATKKTMKKEEQYRMMYNELEQFLTFHCYTESHIKVLDCLLEVRHKPPSGIKPKSADPAAAAAEVNVEEMEIDGPANAAKKPRITPSSGNGPNNRNNSMSLLDLVAMRMEKENSKKHVPFHGVRNLGEKAKLYLNLERAKEQQQQENNDK